MIKLNKILLFIILVVCVVCGLTLASFSKADTATCEQYCQWANYDRGFCSTSCSAYPACLFNTCYYSCDSTAWQPYAPGIVKIDPCGTSTNCLCLKSASCNCSTQTCGTSGCQSQQSYALTIDKNPTA